MLEIKTGGITLSLGTTHSRDEIIVANKKEGPPTINKETWNAQAKRHGRYQHNFYERAEPLSCAPVNTGRRGGVSKLERVKRTCQQWHSLLWEKRFN
ncbi:unnamed protein product [Larinioides sclopetarius]|uniref:Uncharacterized protein n=1 Tax=Larinioides sclopetarius TaxID=280406 RepID=A0AAV1ZEL7_9ARAC